MDWTEQQHHLAGLLGAALTTAYLDNHWITRRPQTREIRVTAIGATTLRKHLGIQLQPTE